MKCAPYDPAGRAGALPPPTSPDDCLAITEEPAADYHVIASRKAAWQSPGTHCEIERSDRRFPRPVGLGMTVVFYGTFLQNPDLYAILFIFNLTKG